jgi:NAD-dependent dihydropyrimidine dehydrogenase PreA subunit
MLAGVFPRRRDNKPEQQSSYITDYLRRALMNTIKIDMDVCNGCMTCYDACFVNVFRWNKEEEKPIVAYPEDCVECNKCELGCPVEAIQVIPDFKGIYWPAVV